MYDPNYNYDDEHGGEGMETEDGDDEEAGYVGLPRLYGQQV